MKALLEKKIPLISSFLEKVSPKKREPRDVILNTEADIFVCFGLCFKIFQELKTFLEGKEKKKLVFIEEDLRVFRSLLDEEDAFFLLTHPKVDLYHLETPLQVEPLAKKLAKEALFLQLEALDLSFSPHFPLFKKTLQETHLLGNLLLRDAADFGVQAFKNARISTSKAYKSFWDLKGTFSKVPAFIVGNGPSLKKNGHLLEELKEKGLIFSAASSLKKVEKAAHMSACVDPKGDFFEEGFSTNIPCFFQARVNPHLLKKFQGDLFLAPDSHFLFLNWILNIEGESFGWTVGNFMTKIAAFLGCDPIIFVGMDHGVKELSSSDEKEDWVKVEREESFFSKPDFLQAIQWTDAFSKEQKAKFFDATEGGLGFGPAIEKKRLKSFLSLEVKDISKELEKLKQAPLSPKPRWEEFQRRLFSFKESSQDPLFLETLLLPLWRVWSPIFEREVEPSSLKTHQHLFFQNVLNAYKESKKSYYENGSLYAELYFLNGKKEGPQTYYFEEGPIKTLENYRQGKLHGEVRLYWAPNVLKRVCFFQEGLRDGPDQIWDEKGTLVDSGSYKKGIPIGEHLRWNFSGALIEKIEYLEDGSVQSVQSF